MPLHPQARMLLDQIALMGTPPLEALSPAQARALPSLGVLAGPPVQVAQVVNERIPGPSGDIPVRRYLPEGIPPFPALVYFHGGGWVIGDLESHDVLCRALCHAAGCAVVSVDYRLAPEHKFPAAVDDCYAATCHVARHAAALGLDPSRLAVGGDSAGGNLAAVISLLARERGGPPIAFQLLIYPATAQLLETASSQENGQGYLLTREGMAWFTGHYLRDEQDRRNPYAAPLHAADLSGLPEALIITAEYDPLRDEGSAYAERLRQAGVKVTLRDHEGMIHGFLQMTGVLDGARQAVAEIAQALRAALRG